MVEITHQETYPKPVQEFDGNNAWLSPTGELYPAEHMGHIHLAERLIEANLVPNVDSINAFLGETKLEKLGWVKISAGNVYNLTPITKKQVDVLFDWMIRKDKDTIRCTMGEMSFAEFLEWEFDG